MVDISTNSAGIAIVWQDVRKIGCNSIQVIPKDIYISYCGRVISVQISIEIGSRLVLYGVLTY